VRRPGNAPPILVALASVSCAFGGVRSAAPADPEQAIAACTPEDCVVVDLAVSPEKTGLLTELAKDFNSSDATVDGRRVVVRPKEKASGAAEEQLVAGWPEDPDDPRPVIWSPAARAWGAILDDQLAARSRPAMAGTPTSTMSSPLVIAMPRRMAEALGHPARPIGWADILALVDDPQGWAAHGHPEWGMFRLGKTNPRFSTSGLHAFIAQHYAATGRTSGLTEADLDDPGVVAFNRSVESSVVHYGDTTLTFLNNWHRADQLGNPYRYASAVAVEEKSVIDYNLGNPDGIDDPGEVPRRPREPLVAIYPKEGTIFSDSPFYVLDADWVSPTERDAARAFTAFVLRPESQAKVTRAGFRAADPGAIPGPPITSENGVDPQQPRTTMELPGGIVMSRMLDSWVNQRKGARVMLVVDVSGSMAEEASPGTTKLALAKAAATQSLGQFRADDLVGLRQFSTGLGPQQNEEQIDLAPVAPVAEQKERLADETESLTPANGTPLYAVAQASVRDMVAGYDPSRINAVVLLTDGRNEDGDTANDKKQRDDLVRFLQNQAQGDNAKPVRLFTIGYGASADAGVLKEMAEATNGRYYGATADPTMITRVFVQVISNF
jgi:Ca-activated chloride channel family protein